MAPLPSPVPAQPVPAQPIPAQPVPAQPVPQPVPAQARPPLPVQPALAQSSVVNRIGGSAQFLPVGTLTLSEGMNSASEDTAVAFAMAGLFEFGLNPNLSIGFAPRLLLNVKGESGTDSAKQFDFAIRLAAGAPVGNGQTRMYGFVAPGYSVLLVPDWPDGLDNPAGLVVGFGGGIAFEFQPGLELVGELGYQVGFQSVTQNGETANLETDFLHVGFGLMTAL